jgi:hypothetical protein
MAVLQLGMNGTHGKPQSRQILAVGTSFVAARIGLWRLRTCCNQNGSGPECWWRWGYIGQINVTEEYSMAKGDQRSNKMTKKPKKDSGPVKEVSSTSTRPTPPTTSVLPKGKLKNKPA